MKDLVKYLAQALVDSPDEVSVSEIEGEQTSVIELRVAKDDLGKIIGKHGRTAQSIRTILSAASAKNKKRAPNAKVQTLLFDLESDLGEQNNLAESKPEVVAKLKARMLELDAQITKEARKPWFKN